MSSQHGVSLLYVLTTGASRQTLDRHTNACNWYFEVFKRHAGVHRALPLTHAAILYARYKSLTVSGLPFTQQDYVSHHCTRVWHDMLLLSYHLLSRTVSVQGHCCKEDMTRLATAQALVSLASPPSLRQDCCHCTCRQRSGLNWYRR